MESQGKLMGMFRNFSDGSANVQISVDEGCLAELEGLKDCELDITIKKHRETRSHAANALLWAIIRDIQNATGGDKWQIYKDLLRNYGQYTYILVKPAAVESMREIWRELEEIGPINVNGEEAVQMLCFYGSHTYTKAEFSRLIDGALSELDNLGITRPSKETVDNAMDSLEHDSAESRKGA